MDYWKVLSKNTNKLLIVITHDNDIAQMADRIVQIEDGRILIGSDLNAKE
ncbi:MAG: hypothetical protein ACLTAI_02450 [Thomasclavelia sp.]